MKLFRLFALFLSLCPIAAYAQSADVSGVVQDSSGAAIPKASVEFRNQDTGVRQQASTNESGYYHIPAIQPGKYDATVQAKEFQTLTQEGIVFQTDTARRVDFSLKVGSSASVITVIADNGMIQPNNGQMETHISEKEFEELPLLQLGRTRNPSTFVYLVPGVQGNIQLNGGEYTGATNVINVNGSSEYTTELLMEGFPGGQSRIAGNFTESSPPADAISEFKMTTTGLPAEYGHTGSAVGSFSIKSGTNELHGSAYEYFRNSAMDANSWLAKHNGAKNSSTKQNEFGATLGGPVILPHLYNGHDRTFFFFSYGGSRLRGPNVYSQVQVPTIAERQGLFTFTGSPTSKAGLYDPASTQQSGSTYTRAKFPVASTTAIATTYQIPLNRFDPMALSVLNYYPNPNQSGTLNYGGWTGNPLLDPNLYTAKVDHVLSSNQHLAAVYIRTIIPRTTIGTPIAGPLGENSYQVVASHTGRLNYNWMISPSLLNNASFGFDRFTNINLPEDTTSNYPEQIHFPEASYYFPEFTFTNGYTAVADTANSSDIENDFYYKDQIVWQLHDHTISIGGEYRRMQYNDRSPYNYSGSYGFDSLETGNPNSQSGTGDGFASFLLGQVNSGTLTEPLPVYGRKSYWGFFVQDDYRMTHRLTLNLGLRYEWQPPSVEAHDRMSIVSLTTPNSGAGNLPGALTFAGAKPLGVGGRTLFPGNYSGVGPRFGFAFSATPAIVVRGAYGIYYSDPYYNGYTSVVTSGYQVVGTFASSNNGVSPAFIASNGIPQTYPTQPTLTPTAVNGQNASFYGSNMAAMPRIQDWNFNIQHQLTKNTAVTFVYIGSHSTRQINPNMVNVNQDDPKYLSLGSLLTQQANSAAAEAAGIQVPYTGFTGSVAQALRPYPQYLTLSSVSAKAGASKYNSAAVIYEAHTSWGLMLHVGYTFSKDMGYASPSVAGASGTTNVLQNAYNPQTEWALLPQDVRHALVFFYTYSLPFGEDGKYLTHGVGGKLAGGWKISGIQHYQSGYPLGIVMTNNLPIFNSVLRPDIVPGASRSLHISNERCNPSADCIFNKNAFVTPQAYTFGNSNLTYSDLRNFPVFSEDVSVVKETPLGEHVRWSLYGQSTNILNRHRFYAIETNFSDASFGTPSSVSFPRQIQIGSRFQF
jgi:hypothetical protein